MCYVQQVGLPYVRHVSRSNQRNQHENVDYAATNMSNIRYLLHVTHTYTTYTVYVNVFISFLSVLLCLLLTLHCTGQGWRRADMSWVESCGAPSIFSTVKTWSVIETCESGK